MADWGEVISRCGLTVKGRRPSDHQCEMGGLIVTEIRRRDPGHNEETIAGAIATAIQESNLTNLAGGDKDSLGLFQQRPSMGWGTRAQIRDPRHAIHYFLERVQGVSPGYLVLRAQGIGWLEASHRVQRSAHRDAPRRWYDEGVKFARCWPRADS